VTKAVRMTEHIEGEFHDGETWRSWPPAGEVGVFDDVHADDLVASGRAEHVKAEKAETRAAETRPAPDDAEKRTTSKSTRSGDALKP
jgi:hypothetical protein